MYRCASRSPIKPEAMLPRVSLHTPLAMDGKGGLGGYTIVELSKGGVSSSSACALLADAGATIIKLEPYNGGDSWRIRNPASFAQFDRGRVFADNTSQFQPPFARPQRLHVGPQEHCLILDHRNRFSFWIEHLRVPQRVNFRENAQVNLAIQYTNT